MYTHREPKAEYPLAQRLILEAASELGYRASLLDPRTGFLLRVEHEGRQTFIMPNSFPLNDEVACTMARDKVFTYMMCEEAGIPVPEGDYFFTDRYPEYAEGKRFPDALTYAEGLGYPLVFKPNRLTKGKHVCLAKKPDHIRSAVARLRYDDHIYILQKPVNGLEFRLLQLDGRLLLAYRRLSLKVKGNGRDTIRDLVRSRTGADIKDNMEASLFLRGEGLGPDSKLPFGQTFCFQGINKNIHAGGMIEDCTSNVPEPLREAATAAAVALNLRLAGVDCILDGETPYVIEVNSKPMLSGYYHQCPDRRSLVEGAYREILKALF